MPSQSTVPEIPHTADELLGEIDNSKMEALAVEVGMDERMLYRKMREIFDYVNAAFEGGVSSEGNARYVDFVYMGPKADPRSYDPQTTPFYRLINRTYEDGHLPGQFHENYLLGKIDPSKDPSEQGNIIFDMPFNPYSHKLLLGTINENDQKAMFKADQILSRPNLYLRNHLLESKLNKYRRQKKEKRLGKKAISFGRVI
jgi:hypothetical protein